MTAETTVDRRRSVGTLVVSLLVTAFLSTVIIVNRVNGAIDYRSSYVPPFGHTTGSQPIASRVLFIIVDGLRDDVSHTMPHLEHLRARGSWGRSVVVAPSFSQPSWATLVSGAPPEINGSSLINAPYDRIRTLQVDTLFDVVHRVDLPTSIVGEIWWKRLLRQESLSEAYYVSGFYDPDDEQAYHAARTILHHQQKGLVLVYFGAYDEMSHKSGALSKPALHSAARIDQFIGELGAEADAAGTCVVVTADHGHIDVGGHGGTEYEVTHPPVVFVGTGAAQGQRANMREEDIAPTICALLGVPLPNSSMGLVRSDYVLLPPGYVPQIEQNELAQYASMAGAYVAGLQPNATRIPSPNALHSRNDRAPTTEKPSASGEVAADGIDGFRARIGSARAYALRWSHLRHVATALIGFILVAILFLRFTPIGVPTERKRRFIRGALAVATSYLLLAAFGVNTSTSILSRSGQPVLLLIGIACSTLLPAALLMKLNQRHFKFETVSVSETTTLQEPHLCSEREPTSVVLTTWVMLLFIPLGIAYGLAADLSGYPATGIDLESFQNTALLQVVTASMLSLAVILGETYSKRRKRLHLQ